MTDAPVPPTAPDLEVLLTALAGSPPACGRLRCPGVLIAGRGPTAHLALPADDRQASRVHFLIELDAGFCRLTNQSDHGTFVNGALISTQCDLRHGDLVRAGKSVFYVEVRRGGEPAELALSPTVLWQPADGTTAPAAEAPPPPPPPPSPVRIPGYLLVRMLGRGGMGSVWLVQDRMGQPAACKVIRPDLALDPETCARFRRETNHLRDLRHRHIVGFRDAGESQGLLYLVMDYVNGSNLAELLQRQGPFAVGRAVRLICQVLEALGAAHGNGVVHRDVKPSNVLVQDGDGGEEVRLADFGLAKAYVAADVGAALTLDGVMGGTLAFAAPEMVSDFRRAGPLADQYGAAATLYTLLAGRHPYDASTVARMITSIRAGDVVPLRERRPDLPAELDAAIHRALDREPRLRFPTVHALRAALEPYAG